MTDEVSATNPNGHNQNMYTNTGPCLLEAAGGLGHQPGQDKFLIVLTDGEPSNGASLTNAVRKINADGKVNIVALGLGEGTKLVEDYFPISLPNIQASELPDVLPELLKDILTNPKKYKLPK